MRKLYWLTVMMLSIGCTDKVVNVPSDQIVTGIVTVKESELTDKQKIALLRAEAHKRNLKWRVWCTAYFEGDKEEFAGWAIHGDTEFSYRYIEGGEKANWFVHGDTQANTAYALYQAIQGQETYQPEHKQSDPERKRMMCKPEISGQ